MVVLDFGFTACDTELLGGRRYADPLGTGPVWTNLARRLIPNLTAQSTRGQGFQLLLSGVDFFERYEQSCDGRAQLKFSDFYVLLEQAFAHATYRRRQQKGIAARECWPLPGSRAVRGASGQVKIGLDHHLLDSQMAGGTWGLYAAAAERSALIGTDPPRLADDLRELVRNGYRSRTLIAATDDIFRALGRAADESYAIHRASFSDDLAKVLDKLPHADLLRERLIERPKYATPPGYPQARTALLGEVARRLRREWQKFADPRTPMDEDVQASADAGAFYRRFAETCAGDDWDADRFGDAARIFGDIVVAESFLAPISNLFDALFGYHGRKVTQVAAELAAPVAKLEDAKQRFRGLAYWSATARGRAALYGALDCSATEHLIESLVETHARVAETRGRSPWLLIEGGTVTALIDQDGIEQPDLSPSTAWRTTYYLHALLSLAEDLDVH